MSNNGGNNAITTIEKLFFNIKHKLFYERLTKKVIPEMCEFFMYSTKHITSNNWIAFCSIRSALRLFQAQKIFSIL